MTSIYKRDSTWWVKYTRNGCIVRRSLKTANKRIAQREKQAIEAELLRPHRRAPEQKDTTIEDFCVRWDKWSAAKLTGETQRGRLFFFFLLGIYAGLRLREIRFARWGWFDFSGKLMTVMPDDTFSVKSHKPRTLPMHSLIAIEMEPRAETTGYIFESGRPSGGKSYYRYDPKRGFRTIFKRAGVEYVYTTGTPARVTPQVLRYSFGSRLVQEGESLKKVSVWMGHSSVRVTERHDLHLLAYDEGIDRI